MFLRFGFSNFHSVREYQELSLVSTSLQGGGTDLIPTKAAPRSVVPVALIYGANASGKTTLLRAINMMGWLVVQSHARLSPNEKLPHSPFLLDDKCGASATQFDCDFVLNDMRYHYGFTYTRDAIEEEWLYDFPTTKRRMLFYRKRGSTTSFGKSLTGKNRLIDSVTRPNSLILSAAAQNSHAMLTPVFNYFYEGIYLIIDQPHPSIMAEADDEDSISDDIVRFLNFADTGIVGAKLETQEQSGTAKALAEGLVELVNRIDPDTKIPADFMSNTKEIKLGHKSATGSTVYFNAKLESTGTLRLWNLLRPIFKVIEAGGVIFVDELDSSLHTLLASEVIALFCKSSINAKGAQLVATTHDTNLLCLDLIRRDQVWFTEKDAAGASHIYPLTDIKTRSTDNLEKGYLQGRFGAVPFLGSLESLLAKDI